METAGLAVAEDVGGDVSEAGDEGRGAATAFDHATGAGAARGFGWRNEPALRQPRRRLGDIPSDRTVAGLANGPIMRTDAQDAGEAEEENGDGGEMGLHRASTQLSRSVEIR